MSRTAHDVFSFEAWEARSLSERSPTMSPQLPDHIRTLETNLPIWDRFIKVALWSSSGT